MYYFNMFLNTLNAMETSGSKQHVATQESKYRHTSYYRALLIIVHQSSLCLPCVNGPIFVTIREVHVPNINLMFFWLRNRIETGIL